MRDLILALFFSVALGSLHAQVYVHQEPRHHTVFANNQLRALNVVIPPGDTSQFHIHHTPSLFLFFTSTNTGSQLKGGGPVAGKSTAGTILFENLAPPHLRIHRVWNNDPDTFHVMDVELLGKDGGFTQTPLTSPDLTLAVDTGWVRAYRLVLPPVHTFSVQAQSHAFFLVSFGSANVKWKQGTVTKLRKMQAGTCIWIPAGKAFAFRNAGADEARFALLELPD